MAASAAKLPLEILNWHLNKLHFAEILRKRNRKETVRVRDAFDTAPRVDKALYPGQPSVRTKIETVLLEPLFCTSQRVPADSDHPPKLAANNKR